MLGLVRLYHNITFLIGFVVMTAGGVALAAFLVMSLVDYIYRQMHCTKEFMAFVRSRMKKGKV